MEDSIIDIKDLAFVIADNTDYGYYKEYGRLPNCVEYNDLTVRLDGRFDISGYVETGCYVCTDATVNIEDIRIYNSEGDEVEECFSIIDLERTIENELLK